MKRFGIIFFSFLLTTLLYANDTLTSSKKFYYLTPDISIPFWKLIAKGITDQALQYGHTVQVLDAHNTAKIELENTVKAIQEKAEAIIVSPTNSSACVTILKLAKRANIPVVIADIGTQSGEYVSYISSNNFMGAYKVGKILSEEMIQRGWQDGRVGIIAIPQKRINGKNRTQGFMKALNEHQIKGADLKQLEVWTDEETYRFSNELLDTYPNLRAIWLQTSHDFRGVLQAIKEHGKENEILFAAFDAEPEFLELIPKGEILATGMQQPYLMGVEAAKAMHQHLNGQSVTKNIQLPILDISTSSIDAQLQTIQRNVFGITK